MYLLGRIVTTSGICKGVTNVINTGTLGEIGAGRQMLLGELIGTTGKTIVIIALLIALGNILLSRALAVHASDIAKLTFGINKLTLGMADIGTTEDAELNTALGTVLILNRVQHIGKGSRALLNGFLIGATIIHQTVETHFILMEEKKLL
jgi:hypothetical protein